jgi:hypothetical protein
VLQVRWRKVPAGKYLVAEEFVRRIVSQNREMEVHFDDIAVECLFVS